MNSTVNRFRLEFHLILSTGIALQKYSGMMPEYLVTMSLLLHMVT